MGGIKGGGEYTEAMVVIWEVRGGQGERGRRLLHAKRIEKKLGITWE